MKENKLSIGKVLFTLTLLVIFSSALFGVGIFDFLNPNKTYSYLTDNGVVMNVVQIAPMELNVYQRLKTDTADPTDPVVDNKIDLETTYFATDVIYDGYNVYLKNDEEESSGGFYIRWKFEATLDGTQYTNLNAYFIPNSSEAVLSGDYYYYVDAGGENAMLTAGESVNLLEKIYFTGSYDAGSDSYGSILDDKFSGSNFSLRIVIEGSIEGAF